MIFLGIDGGGSKTTCLVGDENSILGNGSAGPSNVIRVGEVETRASLNNAIQQALKEILNRFDLKNTKSNIELNEKDSKLIVTSSDDFKLKAVVEVLQQKLAKRQASERAAENRVLHGRTKAERARDEANAARVRRELDGHRIDREDDR